MAVAHKDLEERVSILEDLVWALTHDVGTLSEQEELHSFRMKELFQLVLDNQKNHVSRYNDILNQMIRIGEKMEQRCSVLEQDVSLLKKATVDQGSGDGCEKSKLKVPEPKKFDGSRNAKELENFLWDMEQYFQAARVSKRE